MQIPLRRSRRPAARKNKPIARKPKIRWQQLGLADPSEKQNSLPIEEIRRQVATLSSRGLGQGARSRRDAAGSSGSGLMPEAATGGSRRGRRGATE